MNVNGVAKWRTLRGLLAVLAIFALLLAACGDDSGDSEPTAAQGQDDADADDEASPYRIGSIHSVTGPLAGAGLPELQGAQLFVDELNAAGGIDGHPVELIHYDSQSKPEVAVSNTRRLIAEDGVIAIVGPASTAVGAAVEPIVTEAKIPQISQQGGLLLTEENGYAFANAFTGADAVRKAIEYFGDEGITKIGYLTVSDDLGASGDKFGLPLFEESHIDVVDKQVVPPETTDLTVPFAAMRDAGAEAVFLWASGSIQIAAAESFQTIGMPGKLFMLNLNPEVAQQFGDAADVVVAAQPKMYFWEDLEESDPHLAVIQDYVDAWEAAGKPGDVLTHQNAHGYSAARTIAESIRAVGPDSEAIYELWTSGFEVPWNVAGRLHWTNEDHSGFNIDDLAIVTVDPQGDELFTLAE